MIKQLNSFYYLTSLKAFAILKLARFGTSTDSFCGYTLLFFNFNEIDVKNHNKPDQGEREEKAD